MDDIPESQDDQYQSTSQSPHIYDSNGTMINSRQRSCLEICPNTITQGITSL